MPLLTFWIEHRAELATLVQQHVVLVALATSIAAAIGIPVGIVAAHRPALARPLLAFASIGQTLPSLALLGFLIPLPVVGGIGPRTAVIALILYGLLPIVRSTTTGLQSIDKNVIESAVAMGMTRRQLLTMVELPLALPSIVAGVRIAAVVGVGTATIAAFIGAGGLGEYIFRGLSMVDSTLILAGAVPAALLALTVDGGLSLLQRWLSSPRGRGGRPVTIILVAALMTGVIIALTRPAPESSVVVGSKNFTEQLILGELVAQVLERHTEIPVVRRLNLGGTFIADRALRSGEIDIYVEYTGTALTAIFNQPISRKAEAVLTATRELYGREGIAQLDGLGFNNTFAILVRRADAARLELTSISDLRRVTDAWRAGFGHEFLQRQDGYPGLAETYGLTFVREPLSLDLSLMYRALADRQVDVIAGDATSGLIEALDLAVLEDDRAYFPPYDAVPLVRAEILHRHPGVRTALEQLPGLVSASEMRALNRAVDVDRLDVASVVRSFLDRKGAGAPEP
jgi:osmoprotectant transport system permease protein